jgi:hypothetical protein
MVVEEREEFFVSFVWCGERERVNISGSVVTRPAAQTTTKPYGVIVRLHSRGLFSTAKLGDRFWGFRVLVAAYFSVMYNHRM